MAVETGTKRTSHDFYSNSVYITSREDCETMSLGDEGHVVKDAYQRRSSYIASLGIMEKKKRGFPRPPSFIMKRRSNSVGNTKGGTKKPSNCRASCTSDGEANGGRLLEERNDAFEQCKRLKTELETSNDKVGQYETEVELLKSQLRSLYRKELKASEKLSSDSEEVLLNTPTKVTDIRPNINTKAYSDIDPSEHHLRPCKECENLLLTRVSALVEAITLRRYVLQLNKMTEDGENQNFLSENERKLTKTLAEKELLARQLKSVVRDRDKVLVERDRALEEWEKAASKWETTLDQLDTLMIQQNEAKEKDNKTISRLKNIMTEHEEKIKEKDEAMSKLQQLCSETEEQLCTSKKETKDCLNEHDVVLKANFNIAQELRRVNGELKDARMKCVEHQTSLAKAQTLLERTKANNEHIVKQWKHAVKDRKKMQRDIPGIVQSRDEAIQRNLSTLAQLDRVREERDKLARSLNNTEGNGSDISDVSRHSTTECQFCGKHANEKPRYDEMNIFISKTAISQASITVDEVVVNSEKRVMITSVDEEFIKHHNIRKYDEVLAFNQQTTIEVERLRRLISERQTDLNLTIRRYKTPFEITLDTEVPIVKKSKLGCGIHWGVYIKNLSPDGLAETSGNLEIGDYINKINGKNLTKILSSALDKYSKRGDKMSVQVGRRVYTSTNCYCQNTVAMTNVNLRPREKYLNRDSVISIDSNQSLGASSISSIPSYISSLDSASVCSRTASESEYFKPDRRSADVFMIEAGVPPTIAEETSTDDSIFLTKDRRVRSLTHLGKPKYLKKDSSLPRSQSLVTSLNAENTLRARSISRGSMGPFYQSNGSIVSVKRAQLVKPVMVQPANLLTVPVSRERARIIRLDKRSGEKLGLKINGGNCVGIFVVGFHKQSSAEEAGVRVGDRLMQLNSFVLNQVTLDYATRILRMSDTCSYIRMEVQNYSNVDDVLKEGTFDSLYIRARLPHSATCENEISYSIGDKLRVINTRADYDPANETWRWFAVRERPGENNEKVEGSIPAMNYSPEVEEPGSTAIKSTSIVRHSEGDDGILSDDCSIRSGQQRIRRNSVESLSKFRRYRGIKRRSSIESLGSENGYHSDTSKTTSYYEILEEKQV